MPKLLSSTTKKFHPYTRDENGSNGTDNSIKIPIPSNGFSSIKFEIVKNGVCESFNLTNLELSKIDQAHVSITIDKHEDNDESSEHEEKEEEDFGTFGHPKSSNYISSTPTPTSIRLSHSPFKNLRDTTFTNRFNTKVRLPAKLLVFEIEEYLKALNSCQFIWNPDGSFTVDAEFELNKSFKLVSRDLKEAFDRIDLELEYKESIKESSTSTKRINCGCYSYIDPNNNSVPIGIGEHKNSKISKRKAALAALKYLYEQYE